VRVRGDDARGRCGRGHLDEVLILWMWLCDARERVRYAPA
jgi:hypothetical protein